MQTTLLTIVAYLLGSIPTALLIGKAYGIPDIRRFDSGNLGATNVWRQAGGKAAAWVFAGDIGKGVLAIMIARQFDLATLPLFGHQGVLVLCALAAVLGHVYPIYVGFRGGKGVATGLGVMLCLLPLPTLVAVGVFAVMVALTRIVSVESIAGAIALASVVGVQKYSLHQAIPDIYVWLTVGLAILVVYTHRQNIVRLIRGTENRFSLGSDRTGKETGR
ncbi:MAG: glycerol-3-phosphate 1-O-acyltransferase PlsY [bacterium]